MNASRIVRLAMFELVVFGTAKTASPNPNYSFIKFNVPGAIGFGASAFGINDSRPDCGAFGNRAVISAT